MSIERHVSLTFEAEDVRTLAMICELARRYIEGGRTIGRSISGIDEYDDAETQRIRALMRQLEIK